MGQRVLPVPAGLRLASLQGPGRRLAVAASRGREPDGALRRRRRPPTDDDDDLGRRPEDRRGLRRARRPVRLGHRGPRDRLRRGLVQAYHERHGTGAAVRRQPRLAASSSLSVSPAALDHEPHQRLRPRARDRRGLLDRDAGLARLPPRLELRLDLSRYGLPGRLQRRAPQVPACQGLADERGPRPSLGRARPAQKGLSRLLGRPRRPRRKSRAPLRLGSRHPRLTLLRRPQRRDRRRGRRVPGADAPRRRQRDRRGFQGGRATIRSLDQRLRRSPRRATIPRRRDAALPRQLHPRPRGPRQRLLQHPHRRDLAPSPTPDRRRPIRPGLRRAHRRPHHRPQLPLRRRTPRPRPAVRRRQRPLPRRPLPGLDRPPQRRQVRQAILPPLRSVIFQVSRRLILRDASSHSPTPSSFLPSFLRGAFRRRPPPPHPLAAARPPGASSSPNGALHAMAPPSAPRLLETSATSAPLRLGRDAKPQLLSFPPSLQSAFSSPRPVYLRSRAAYAAPVTAPPTASCT
mmetsp:Transcript_13047/g.41330  ORF Transcript_13047/g.41330 Transcript_13047/m.41330 type:complete len:517 (-) Transcript_13047:8-1558(-)